MQRLNNRTEDSIGAFRPLNGRFSNSHANIPPPSRFIALQLVCGLKKLYAEVKQTKESIAESKSNEDQNSFHLPAKKLAGRYKVLELIGKGQSSIIVAAEDLYHFSKKVVAIKIMNLDYNTLGIQEADCILQLNKADPLNVSKVIRLMNKFTFQNHFCMVFELLRPRPLHQYFQDSCFDSETDKLEKIREVAVQVLGVLGFLRRENVIHADLKPENILLESGKRLKIKVVDFGNAIRWIHCEMSLYYDNFELQTLLYRAPEVIVGVPFGPEVDMWSLGCILAELYLGKPLFMGTTKSEVLQEIVSTLGPLPRIPFQSGKFYSNFANFLTSKAGVDAVSAEMRIMKKLNNMRNFTFASFLAGFLHYNPNQRLTPVQAIRHPFLVEQVPFGGFLANTVDETQGCRSDDPTRSGILLSSSQYNYRPHIDDDIRRQQLSGIDLLRAGTRGKNCLPTQPVGRVVPLVVGNTQATPVALSSERVMLPTEASSSKRGIVPRVAGDTTATTVAPSQDRKRVKLKTEASSSNRGTVALVAGDNMATTVAPSQDRKRVTLKTEPSSSKSGIVSRVAGNITATTVAPSQDRKRVKLKTEASSSKSGIVSRVAGDNMATTVAPSQDRKRVTLKTEPSSSKSGIVSRVAGNITATTVAPSQDRKRVKLKTEASSSKSGIVSRVAGDNMATTVAPSQDRKRVTLKTEPSSSKSGIVSRVAGNITATTVEPSQDRKRVKLKTEASSSKSGIVSRVAGDTTATTVAPSQDRKRVPLKTEPSSSKSETVPRVAGDTTATTVAPSQDRKRVKLKTEASSSETRIVPAVAGNITATPDILSPERKRVMLPTEESSSKKRIKLSELQKDKTDREVKEPVKLKSEFSRKARRSLNLIEDDVLLL